MTRTITTADAALNLAEKFHGDQMYGDQPYVTGHLVPVVSMAIRLAEAGLEPDVDIDLVGIVAALHDVIEDTPATAAELAKCGVPDEALGAIQYLTEPEKIGDLTTSESADARAEYIRRAMSAGPVARLVKLADNLVNSDPATLGTLTPSRGMKLSAKYNIDRATMAEWRNGGTAAAGDEATAFGTRLTPGLDGER